MLSGIGSIRLISFLLQILNLRDSWQIYVWLISLSFTSGLTFGSFATKRYVQDQIDRSLKSIDGRLGRIEERLDRHVEEHTKGDIL